MTSRRPNPPQAPAKGKYTWKHKLVAVGLALLAVGAIDVGVSLVGLVPPDDAEGFYAATCGKEYWPFEESADGMLTIRKDWVSSGEVYRSDRGELAGRRFLYPGFRPCRFARKKPAGTIRVFTFGGSTTFGQFVGFDRAFSAELRRKLEEALPDRPVEVINLGCPGMESTRVLALLKAVTRLEPDLLIVCSGHNEMLRGDVTEALSALSQFRQGLLGRSSLARWIKYAAASWGQSGQYKVLRDDVTALEEGKTLTYDPMAVPLEKRHLASREYLDRTAATYAANLTEMVASARAGRTRILFVMPVASLVCPPYLSVHEEGFAQGKEFAALMDAAQKAAARNAIPEALADLDRASRLSPRFAIVWYMKGSLRASTGDRAGALADLQKACDCDARMHRMTSPLQNALTDVAARQGVRLVDARAAFLADLSEAATKKLFLDHCHPTVYGHALIARHMLPAVLAELGLQPTSAPGH
ncbi:MAG: GDSL-type esterase/lipase family protein [Planctomycetota bacterium]|nr:GDSL-type esterase/lipase family protein [Planctomycetota bacterium]